MHRKAASVRMNTFDHASIPRPPPPPPPPSTSHTTWPLFTTGFFSSSSSSLLVYTGVLVLHPRLIERFTSLLSLFAYVRVHVYTCVPTCDACMCSLKHKPTHLPSTIILSRGGDSRVFPDFVFDKLTQLGNNKLFKKDIRVPREDGIGYRIMMSYSSFTNLALNTCSGRYAGTDWLTIYHFMAFYGAVNMYS